MSTLKRRLMLVASHVLVALIVYYATPYVKQTPLFIAMSSKPKSDDYPGHSKKDFQARMAVVIEDKYLLGDKEKDIQWADDFRRNQFEYSGTEKGFGHTAFVFEVVPGNERLAIK